MQITKNKWSNTSPFIWGVALLFLISISLLIKQWLLMRSLWVDEAMLANNIIDYSYGDLFSKTLEYRQLAPLGFLWVSKFSFEIISNEAGLRLFPVIAFAISLLFFLKIIKKLEFTWPILMIAAVLFGFNYTHLAYANEFKPYLLDVCLATLAYYIFFHWQTNKISSSYFVVFFAIAFLFSNTSVILWSSFLGYQIIVQKKKFIEGNDWKTYALSFIAFVIYYIVYLRHNPEKEYFQSFWNNAFMPLNPFSNEAWEFYKSAVNNIFYTNLGFKTFFIVPILLWVSGIVYLAKNNQLDKGLLFTLPILISLGLSLLKLYPFAGRLILFLNPGILIVMLYGIKNIPFKDKKNVFLGVIFMFLSGIMVSNLIPYLPFEKEEVKKAFPIMKQNKEPREKIFVHAFTKPIWEYYEKVGQNTYAKDTYYSKHHFSDTKAFINEFKSLQDAKWIIISQYEGFASVAQSIKIIESSLNVTESWIDYRGGIYILKIQ